jgi:hypothetical protein
MYNSEDMLREEVYDRLIEEFGVTIAVAQILGYKHIEDEKDDFEPTEYRNMKSQLDVNYIISEAIDESKYQTLQRELFRLKGKISPKIKETTIYNKVWKDINGKATNRAKPKEVQKERR